MSQILSKKLGERIESPSPEEIRNEEQVIPQVHLLNALAPIVIPLLLISAGTIMNFFEINNGIIRFVCSPVIALTIGAGLAMFLLSPNQEQSHNQWLTHAIKVAGPILIITGAGGSFGGVLKATELSSVVGGWIGNNAQSEIGLLVLVFLIAAVLKSAQGSSTNAMIITSSLLAPILPAMGWDQPTELALAVMAIGGGAMTASHYNDSYFWVVTEFSGMDSNESIKSFTPITALQGLTVLVLVIALSFIF